MLKIEKGVPMPVTLRDEVLAAFRRMLVGDSFVVPSEAKKLVEKLAKVNEINILTASEGEHNIRVWRVEARPEMRKRGRPPKKFYVDRS